MGGDCIDLITQMEREGVEFDVHTVINMKTGPQGYGFFLRGGAMDAFEKGVGRIEWRDGKPCFVQSVDGAEPA